MLVIGRKPGERFTIGKNITVEIISQRPSGVRIGITAPKNLAIIREEVAERMLLEQHEGPLEEDGGPVGRPELGGTEAALGEDFA